jgi:adenylate cyclase class 2
MAVEIEAKMKVADFSHIREKLKEQGATEKERVLETNTFFDTDDRSLLAADKGLRLRQKKNLATNAESFIVTYKGPRQRGEVKNREELELSVASGKDAFALLDKLGFHRILTFEKKRESFLLDGCEIELDEVPHLGTFVEIEGPREDQILKLREKLGLSERPLVRESYIALLMTFLQEHNDQRRVVTF